MDDQTDVGMARAARGLMTSTGFQVSVVNTHTIIRVNEGLIRETGN